MAENKIYLVLGFHVNYNHSWRGDRNDRTGFGLDSQVIEGILDILDGANKAGSPARGTWDFDNYWSIENIMTNYAPELLDRIVSRVKDGPDEVILDAWNNGMLGATSTEEFSETLSRTISNGAGSGIRDLFGDYSPVIRTQETMFTQGSIELLLEQGVDAICLYYSSVPFDAIRNFVPRLSPNEMFNPLWLNSTESGARMKMIPMYSQGDIVNNVSIKRWARKIRAMQDGGDIPGNALIYINMDADAELWTGLPLPGLLKKIPNSGGLREFIDVVEETDYIEFGTLGGYLDDNEPVGELTVRQDLADGSHTGYNSWTEKEENHRLWRISERARRFARIAEAAGAEEGSGDDVGELLQKGEDSYFEHKLRLLSTTHFGMHSPAVHYERAQVGFHFARNALDRAAEAARNAVGQLPPPSPAGEDSLFSFSVLDQPGYRGGSPTQAGTRVLVRVPFGPVDTGLPPEKLGVFDGDNSPVPFDFESFELDGDGNAVSGVLAVLHTAGGGARAEYRLAPGRSAQGEPAVKTAGDLLDNGEIEMHLDSRGRVRSLVTAGEEYSSPRLVTLGATYRTEKNKKYFTPRAYTVVESGTGPKGNLGRIELESRSVIFHEGKNYPIEAKYVYSVFAGLPYLFLDAGVKFPETPCRGDETSMATGSSRKFDTNWYEVMPAQVRPGVYSLPGRVLRVWKHNYMDAVNYYEFDYGRIDKKNKDVDSCNNHVTDGWVAVSNTQKGFLISCDAVMNSSPAYCPMRLREKDGRQAVYLNPFGTYSGKQFSHLHEGLNVGAAIMKLVAPQLRTVAPSYNGRTVKFRMMMAPYAGDGPPEELRGEAGRFSMPPAVIVAGEGGAASLVEDPVIGEELAAAVQEYELDKFTGWRYKDFLDLRNRGLKPGVPRDTGGQSPLKLIRTIIDGIRDWS